MLLIVLDDDGKLRRKYSNKKIDARKERCVCYLSFEQYCLLMERAGIVSSQIGPSGYHLARYGDVGDYTINSCRFVPAAVNLREKKVSGRQRAASGRNASAAREAARRPDAIANYRSAMVNVSAKRRSDAQRRREEYEGRAHPSYLNENNSQHGSFWITDGNANMKWRDEYGPIPEGCRRGRTVV